MWAATPRVRAATSCAACNPTRAACSPVCLQVLVIFVLMNLFLAVVTDAFMASHVAAARKRGLGESGNVAAMARRLFYRKVMRRAVAEDDAGLRGAAAAGLGGRVAGVGLLKGVDMDGDNELDAGELEVMLRQTKLSEHFTVKVEPAAPRTTGSPPLLEAHPIC